jgi:putative Holliday junction resolvase
MPNAAPPDRAAPVPPSGGLQQPRVVLAFDFGQRRIGVACGDTVSRSASPLEAVPAGKDGPRWELLDKLIREWQPDLAVIGLPYNVDGSDSDMTSAARGFAAELQRRFLLEIALVDERYSSREAEAVDAAAACVILERWFTEIT